MVRDLLREYLLHGGPRPGERLPHEFLLCRQLGCSRNVLREGLALLTADGLLVRERGRGTYVVTTSPAIRIDQGLDLGTALGQDGQQPFPGVQPVSYRVLLTEIVPASAVLAGLLAQPTGTPVVHVERLVEAGGQRMGHWDLHVPLGALRSSCIRALATSHKAEEMLSALGLAPHHEVLRLEAIAPGPWTTELLYRGRPQATLRVSRRFHDAAATVLALAIGRCALPGAAFAVIRRCPAPEAGGDYC
jgi:DNA-binding GntR family transcriptional regulator